MSKESGLPPEEFAALLEGMEKLAPLLRLFLPSGRESAEGSDANPADEKKDNTFRTDGAIPTGGGYAAPGGQGDSFPPPAKSAPFPPPGKVPGEKDVPPPPGGPPFWGEKPPPGKRPGRGGSPDAKCRDALLRALKPYLSPARCAALEDFIRIGHIVDALGVLF